ncbi:hypothetical protein GCM10007382_13330 [Salinibacterium xinjiangense]|uniref:Uncharacterized protein n=1 Tax=Salinibacterium xinjiangense TaxID=386302 RepID=A0A2C8Z2R0_9MICO|nr:hypothetical protein [Salinibacterium xinjiangense]GGK94383.1 hypothetical protein GCM10007382_13330 [Salinibacterium xinjiangense]SOE57876.1 hypothetical protein SAMN06296378_0690 [Salinibacterium xinjiangense]
MTDPINTTPATNLYQPVPPKNVQPRPALLPRQRAGARLAGIISFLALSVGFWMLGVPLTILAVVGLIGAMFSAAGSTFGNLDWYRQGKAIIDQLELEVWIVPLGIIAGVGLVLMVVALFTSVRILRSHDVAKPWPVTWAATGIAIVASWIVSATLSVPLQVVGGGVDDNSAQSLPISIGIGLLGFLVSIVATAAVGWLSWWLAAHLLRAADSANTANPAEAPTRNHD